MAEDLGTQLQIQQQINKVLQDRNALLAANEKSLNNQVQVAINLCKALKCEDLDKLEEGLKGVNDQLQQAAANSATAGAKMEEAANQGAAAAQKANAEFEKQNKLLTAGKGAVLGLAGGLISGFKGAFGMVKNLGKGLFGIIGTIGKVGKSILSLPFKLMGGLIGMAQSGGGGGPSPIKVELENIRKEFGSLASNEGKAAASSLGQFRDQANNLAGTGLTLRKVFGMGPGGVAKAMAYNLETMKALGPAAAGLADVFSKSAVELAMFRKGLGLAADEMASLVKHADAAGKDPVDAMREFSSMAIQMGDKFGISGKTVAKSMAAMAKDVANFGQLSVRELGQAAVYAAKLGIEVKELQGLVAKFDNFEDAAKGAAHLSQAFGMNVDAIKMMNAQNPAERLSMLQKAFKATGKSVDQMSRQELKLLAAQSGLSEEAAKMAFSQKGLGMSYDDIQKAGGKAEKKQLSQAEAMSKLADSIERVFGSGGGGKKFKGFFDAFAQGFGRGVKRSKEFKDVMKNIRKSLKVVYKGGQEIGKMFVKMFPGVKKMLGGLKDLFDPKRFKGLMKDVKKVFKQFFGDLKNDPEAGVKSFFKNMKEVFKKFFKSGGDGASQVMEGGKVFLKAIGGIFKGLLTMAVEGLAKLFNKIADALENPPEVPSALGKAFKSLGKAAVRLLGELWKILKPALIRMLTVMWEKAKPQLMKALPFILKGLLVKVLLTAGASALKGAVVGKLGGMISGAFGKAFGAAGKKLTGMAGPAGKIGGFFKKGMGPATDGVGGFLKKMGKMNVGDLMKASFKVTIMSVVLMPALLALAIAIKAVSSLFTLKEALTAVVAMVAIAITIIAMDKAIDAASKISLGSIGKAILGIVGAAALVVTGILVLSLALRVAAGAFRGIDWIGVGIAMIAIAIAVAAIGAMIYVASLVPAGMIATAAVNMATAGLFALAVGVFSLAMAVATPAIQMVPWESLLMPMLAMAGILGILAISALAAIGLGALAVQASIALVISALFVGALWLWSEAMALAAPTFVELAPSMQDVLHFATTSALIMGALLLTAVEAIAAGALSIPGIIGLALVTLFVAVLAEAFVPALSYFNDQAGDLPFKPLLVNMGKTALIIAALAAGAYAVTFALPAFLLGTIAVVLASAFVYATGEFLLEALKDFNSKMPDVEMLKGMAKGAGWIALITAAMAAMAFMVSASLPAFLIGILGVWGMQKFLSGFSEDGLPAISQFAKDVTKDAPTFESAKPGIETLGEMFEILGKAADLSRSLLVFGLPFIGDVMMSGITVIPCFTEMLTKHIGKALTDINNMDIADPGSIKSKIEAMGGVMEMLGTLADLATMLIEADSDAISEGANSGDALGASALFLETLFKGVKDIIDKITTIEMDAGQIRAAAAVGKVLGAIGTMIQALAPSPELIKSLQTTTKSSRWMGLSTDEKTETNTEAISAVADFIKTIMDAIADKVPDMVEAVAKAASKIKNPEKASAQMDVVAKALKIVGDFAKAIGTVIKLAPAEVKEGFFSRPSTAAEKTAFLRTMISSVATIFIGNEDMGGEFQKVFNGVMGVAKRIKNPEKMMPKIEAVAAMFGIVGKFADAIAKVAGLMPKKVGESEELSDRLPLLIGENGLVTKIVNALSGKEGLLGKIFMTLKKMVDKLPDTGGKAFMEKVQAVGDMFGIVGAFATAMSDLAGIMPNTEGVPPDVQGLITYVSEIVKSVTGEGGAMQTTFEGINKMLDMKGVKDLAKKGRLLKKLGDALKFVGDFASAIGALKSLGEGEEGKSITDVFQSLSLSFSQGNLNTIGTVFGNLADFSSTHLRKAKFHNKKLQDSLEFVQTAQSVLSALSEMPENIETKVTTLKDGLATLSELISTAGDDDALKIAVDVGKGLSQNGKVTVKHENVNITVNLEMKWSADDIARHTIKAMGSVNKQPGYKVFAGAGE